MLDLRDRLTESEVTRMSQQITDRVMGAGVLRGANTVALYSAFRREVRTDFLFHRLQLLGKRICFPRLAECGMTFIEVEDLSRLIPGRWSILEPSEGLTIPPQLLEAVVLPGVAFDEGGKRVGFGKGAYDKALKGYGGLKVGLAYEFQMLEEIPFHEEDVTCDWIFTEQRVIRRKA